MRATERERAGEQGPIDFISPDDPFLWQKVIATERAGACSAEFAHGVQFFTFSHPRLHLSIGSVQNSMYMGKETAACGCVLVVHSSGAAAAAAVYWAWLIRPNQVRCLVGLRHAPIYIKKMRAAKDTPCFVYHLHRGHRHSSSSSSAGAQAVPLCRRCSSLSCSLSNAACQLPAERELIDAPEIALLACKGGFACGKTPSAETR